MHIYQMGNTVTTIMNGKKFYLAYMTSCSIIYIESPKLQ